jgi:hypothetical protein
VTENTAVQQLQLVNFALAMAAAVCGCIFTLKIKKKITN